MKDTIDNTDLLIIRACKRKHCSGSNINIISRVIARGYALHLKHVSKADVAYHLSRIVRDYDLIKEYDWCKFLTEDLNPKKWWTKEVKDYMDNLIDVLISKIACTQLSEFPRYPKPAWFKNKYNNLD